MRPIALGDVVMRRGQRSHAATDDLDEAFDVARIVLRLVDEAADEIEDIAHPVVELGNQQFLLLLRAGALGHRFVGQPQDDLEQRDPQAFGNLDFGIGPFLGAALDGLLPRLEALARGQPGAIGGFFSNF